MFPTSGYKIYDLITTIQMFIYQQLYQTGLLLRVSFVCKSYRKFLMSGNTILFWITTFITFLYQQFYEIEHPCNRCFLRFWIVCSPGYMMIDWMAIYVIYLDTKMQVLCSELKIFQFSVAIIKFIVQNASNLFLS